MATLGVARGLVELIVTGFQKGAGIVQTTSRQVSKDVEGIGVASDRAGKATESAMTRAAKGVAGLKTQILAVTVAAGALTALGVKSAQDVKKLTTSIELLAGSQKSAQKILDDTRKIADEFNSPYLDLLQSAKAFLPLAKQNNLEMNELQKLALKIKAVAPQKTFDEIKFSVSEALSGDFVSIKDALDLSRKQRDELKKSFELNGPQAVLTGISKILEARGFDDDMLKKFGDSGANAFEVLRSEVTETMATAFTPLLQDVVLPLIKEFGNFLKSLRDTSPDLLKLGAGITAIVALGAPLIGFLSSAVMLWNALGLSAAGAGTAMKGALSGTIGKLGMGALAVAGGVELGKAGATALANAGVGDEGSDLARIRKGEDAGDILGERVKQMIVIFADAVIELAKLTAKAGAFLWNAVDQIINVFKLLGTFLSEFGGNIQKVMGQILIALGQFVKSIPGQEGAGASLITGGVQTLGAGAMQVQGAAQERNRLAKRLSEGFAVPDSVLNDIDARFQKVKDTVVGGLAGMLFPVEQAAEKVAEDLGEAGSTVGKALLDSEEFQKSQQEEIVNATKQYNEDLKNLDDEKNSAILEANTQFADDQVKIAREAVEASQEALADLIRDREKMNTDFVRDGQKAERDRERKIRDEQIKAQRQEVEDVQAHAAKLEQMRADQERQRDEALMNLDFKKVFEDSFTNASSLQQENTDFAAQREARNLALSYELQDMQTAFADERNERLIKFNQDLSDRSAAYQLETQQLAEQQTQKQIALTEAHTAELAQITTKYQREYQLRQEAMQRELAFLMMSEEKRNAFLLAEQQKYMAQALQLAGQFGIKMSQALNQAAGGGRTQTNLAGQTAPTGTRIGFNSGTGSMSSGSGSSGSGGSTGGNTGTTSRLGFGMALRAGGGGLMAGQSASVNEPWSSGIEKWISGGRTYDLPGAGIFTPSRGGRVDANKGGGTVIVNLNAPIDSGLLTVPEAIVLIRNGVEQGKLELLNETNGGG